MSGEFKRAYSIVKGYVQREWERIDALERLSASEELKRSLSVPSTTPQAQQESVEFVRDAAHARRILDVTEGATYAEIEVAYQKLNEMSGPEQFAPGSEDYRRALKIQRSIHDAYRILIEEFSVTERRFRSIEIP